MRGILLGGGLGKVSQYSAEVGVGVVDDWLTFGVDQYTPSQLIMVSHDRLAQFWEGFGHISYYQRVDLDALLRYTG